MKCISGPSTLWFVYCLIDCSYSSSFELKKTSKVDIDQTQRQAKQLANFANNKLCLYRLSHYSGSPSACFQTHRSNESNPTKLER